MPQYTPIRPSHFRHGKKAVQTFVDADTYRKLTELARENGGMTRMLGGIVEAFVRGDMYRPAQAQIPSDMYPLAEEPTEADTYQTDDKDEGDFLEETAECLQQLMLWKSLFIWAGIMDGSLPLPIISVVVEMGALHIDVDLRS